MSQIPDLLQRTVVIQVSGPDGPTCVDTTWDTLAEADKVYHQMFETAEAFLKGAFKPTAIETAVVAPITVSVTVASINSVQTTSNTFTNLEQAHKISKRMLHIAQDGMAYNVDTAPTPPPAVEP